ncbi:MAG: hypothetical protein K1X86_12045 [Ignavibacteria bacterium]|nr:hypothetical protein [Ignavibacteria bacterium]
MEENKFQNIYRIKSSRKENWNYGLDGGYFVTICTKGMNCYFGNIVEAQYIASLQMTEIGKIAHQHWLDIPKYHPYVILDEFSLMPNHLHGILIINKNDESRFKGNYKNKFGSQSNNLASIVRRYKAAVKTFAVKNNIPFAWQAGYYDRIVRNEEELFRIRKYIHENAYKWEGTILKFEI